MVETHRLYVGGSSKFWSNEHYIPLYNSFDTDTEYISLKPIMIPFPLYILRITGSKLRREPVIPKSHFQEVRINRMNLKNDSHHGWDSDYAEDARHL